jgi:hypothetical protein
MEQDRVRILDFYLLFPFRISGIRLMPAHRKYRQLASEFPVPYGDQPADQFVFDRMRAIQIAALDTLGEQGLIVAKQLALHMVQATTAPIAKAMLSRIEAANEQHSALMEFLELLATQYNLSGPNGLKARTGLLEYRYDSV